MNNFCHTPTLAVGRMLFWLVLSHAVIGFLLLLGVIEYSWWISLGSWIGSFILGDLVSRVFGWMSSF